MIAAVAQSDGLTIALAVLNVLQTLALAFIADRSRRVRQGDGLLERRGEHSVRQP